MKTYTLILTILLSLFTILSCNNDDNPTQPPEPHPIEGKWSLVFISGGLNPSMNFNMEDIVWDFKNDETMNVELRIGVEPHPADTFIPPFLGSDYTYNINTIEGEIVLTSILYPTIHYEKNFIIDQDTLEIFENPGADGLYRKFIRN
ncbi:hypothetical protein [Moheibacter stercoris]|uniref:Lipocalin-like domain-containing protein n=1 Tax=Moheibacter stercoris TaxID=1628251 RepID=A0ABV2LWU9_9FLAO